MYLPYDINPKSVPQDQTSGGTEIDRANQEVVTDRNKVYIALATEEDLGPQSLNSPRRPTEQDQVSATESDQRQSRTSVRFESNVTPRRVVVSPQAPPVYSTSPELKRRSPAEHTDSDRPSTGRSERQSRTSVRSEVSTPRTNLAGPHETQERTSPVPKAENSAYPPQPYISAPVEVPFSSTMEEGRATGNSDYYDNSRGICNIWVKLGSCLGVVLFIVVLLIAIIVDSVHIVDEGKVGIYFTQGALEEKYTSPGVHWAVPFVTEIQEVVVRPQTDKLGSISAVTKDGIQMSFRNTQVISDVELHQLIPIIRKFGIEFRESLVFDRIAEELRLFCAAHTVDEVYNTMFMEIVSVVKKKVEASIVRLGMDGIKILNLVVNKPEIPDDIARNYKQVKVQWTQQLVATQQQKTEKIMKETESIKAVADAERFKKVLEIDLKKNLLKKEAEKNVSMLDNQITKDREETLADVAAYMKTKEATANTKLYSDNYVKLEMAKALAKETKFYFSGKESIVGSLLEKIMN